MTTTNTKTTSDIADKGSAAPVVTQQPTAPEKASGPQQSSQAATASAAPPPNGTPPPIRTAEILSSGSNGLGAGPRAQMMTTLQRSVGNTRVSSLMGRAIQTKLSVGAVDDPQEREADRVAETVTQQGSQPKSSVQRQIVMKHSLTHLAKARPQTKEDDKPEQEAKRGPVSRSLVESSEPASHNEEKHPDHSMTQPAAKVSLKSNDEKEHPAIPGEEMVQRAVSGESDGTADANMEGRIKSPSGGQSLPEGVQREMEAGLGADFSQVRVHDNEEDRSDAQRLNAKAFTHGSDVWLGPGASANDSKLMAHELTHVVQQGGATQRKPADELKESPVTNAGSSAHTSEKPHQHPESANLVSRDVQTIQRLLPPELIPPLVVFGFEGAVAVGKSSTYELKGNGKFEPNIFLRAYINSQKTGALVNVRFGSMASGKMFIEKRGDEYFAAPTPLPMTHSDISPPGGTQHLSLIVSIGPGNEITGSIGVTKALPPNSIGAGYGSPEDQARLLQLLIGESGSKGKLEDYKLENELKGGHLNFQYAFLNRFHKGTYLIGAAVMVDEAFAFKGTLHTAGKGLVASDTEIKRDKRGDLIGNVQMSTDWEGKGFTGKLALTYEDGVLEIRGSLSYKSPLIDGKKSRIEGEVNVVATEESRARELIASELAAVQEGPKPLPGGKSAAGQTPSPDASGGTAPSSAGATGNTEESLAITAWGMLRFIVTDKIEAHAAFVVDPEGFLTVRGTIRAPHKITLMDAKPTPQKKFFDEPFQANLPVAPGVGIRGKVHIKLFGDAEFGPLTLHDITITGLYSTNPKTGSQIQISAKLNLSGSATATLGVDLQLAARVGSERDYMGGNVGSANLDTEAKATVKGVVEAEPTIKRQGEGEDSLDKTPKYTVGGELFIGGELDIALKGDLVFTVLGKDVWEIHLGNKVFPIAGFGLSTKAAYTIGSDEAPAVEITRGSFRPDRFIKQIIENKRAKDTDAPVKGSFKEGGKEKGHVIPEDVVPPAPPQPPKTQVVQFIMDNAVHNLFLTLGGPNDPVTLEMATKREPVKPKIQKAQKELIDAKNDQRTDDAAKEKIDRRIKDLNQTYRDATSVEQAASKLGAEPQAAELNVPGLRELGEEFQDYGERYHVSDLADPTPGQAQPSGTPPAGAGTGKATKAVKPLGDGKDYERIKESGELLDLTDYMNPIGQQFPPRSLPPDYESPLDKKGRSNRKRAKLGLTGFLPRKDRNKDDFVELHHTSQDFFSTLDETSHTFHQSVVDDPDYHQFAGDPGYQTWREWFGEYAGKIRRLGEIYNKIRGKYWRRRF